MKILIVIGSLLAAVTRLMGRVVGADALCFITPEFNYGLPANLKNIIDWASRPAYNSPLKGKPALAISPRDLDPGV